MTLWSDLGFRDNPYAVTPIPATEEGERLLVGRDDELRRLRLHLTSLNTHPTIEGDNGVGKTSLAAIATYQELAEFLRRGNGALFLAAGEPFQLVAQDNIDDLQRRVLFGLARAFIDNLRLLKLAGKDVPDVGQVQRWLDSPLFRSASGGAAGFSLGGGVQANTSAGFDEAGFQNSIVAWLRACFPTQEAGGFVCVLDNLELLETSAHAKAVLEAARDTVLALPGVRWVLCGARGIIRSSVSSPRLQGVLADPIELEPLPDDLMPDVVQARVREYQIIDDAYIPVDADGFRHLYGIMNSNLRNALKFAQDYSAWMSLQGERPATSADKLGLIESWLAATSEDYEKATRGVTNRGWEVFDRMVELEGSCSPSDYEEFGFNSSPAMRPYVKQLEDSQLVLSAVDDSDQRRRTITLTPRGWLVRYRRRAFRS